MDKNLLNLCAALLDCKNYKIIYIKTDPEVLDISDKNLSFFLEIYWSNKKFKINLNKSNFGLVFSIIKQAIFKNKFKIITYNFKNYCSAYKFFTNKDIEIESLIFDLKIISSILGQKITRPPESFKEAYLLFKNLINNKWDGIKDLYSSIHLPLLLKVIPGIENFGILDYKEKKIKKSYYEIESQENSRLSNFNYLSNCFLPMNMKKEDKENYIPINQEELFVYFDYKNMEVSILENLTKDASLTKILTSYQDFYEGLYREIVSPDGFDKEKRKKMKNIFLPYIYGAGENLISEKNNIKIEVVKEITKRIRDNFKKTFNWLENYSNSYNVYYQNSFGKIRKIEEKYKSINFIIQSTSSVFCLDKLIDIYNILDGKNINFYIHDGYGFIINKKDIKEKIKIIKKILVEENKKFKGIHLNVSCTYGRDLNNMIEYNFEEEYEKNMQ